ncbi:hypothetical protein PR048_021785 [Dryococelus australis]|uniref:Uncharacterized protein n=1 Tax=Dryococelus australis TaxID=614101 RepID=A0ABQ9GZ85_9NEOP|nr:hypothetical protein PR048_021785 [Dryococelus australis]
MQWRGKRKIPRKPANQRPRFTLVRGEQSNHSATASPTPAENCQPERKGGRKREIPEKTHRLTSSSSTIPTCENPGVTRPGIEPGSPWWEASALTVPATTTPMTLCTHLLYDQALTGERISDMLLASHAILVACAARVGGTSDCFTDEARYVAGAEENAGHEPHWRRR